ncbi:hypothetical protein CHELA40_14999 [Chelatococcus asaccharovorans]|nr:hypothetical protein CHELA17_60622 [Chelatococcus asaccharovorans]CAH1681145.1 hypothetical protein CHELA40_14999 [Chelatococcus asaccharovorans]
MRTRRRDEVAANAHDAVRGDLRGNPARGFNPARRILGRLRQRRARLIRKAPFDSAAISPGQPHTRACHGNEGEVIDIDGDPPPAQFIIIHHNRTRVRDAGAVCAPASRAALNGMQMRTPHLPPW